MHRIVSYDEISLIVVVAPGVEVAVEAREVTAGNFEPQPVAREEVIAEIDRLEGHFVYFSRLHPNRRLVVAIAVTHTLNVLNQIEGSAVGINVVHAEREIGVFCARRDVERHGNRPAHFRAAGEWRRGVHVNVIPRFDGALVERAEMNRVAFAAAASSVGSNRIPGIIDEPISVIGGPGALGQRAVAVKRIRVPFTAQIEGFASAPSGGQVGEDSQRFSPTT